VRSEGGTGLKKLGNILRRDGTPPNIWISVLRVKRFLFALICRYSAFSLSAVKRPHMSSILVIEDDGNKLTQLCSFLRDSFQSVDVRTARSLQSGIKRVRESIPTLVLLDMTLPNFDATPDDAGGQTHNF